MSTAGNSTHLEALAAKYGTDKLEHGYIPFYVEHLPKEPKRILEIGVKEGRSMQMWSNYFPNAEIHGLDLFAEITIESIRCYLLGLDGDCNNNIALHQGNQCDWRVLEELRKYDFDVIIEDCSHNCRDQWITLMGLIDSCKLYFIEDLHSNTDSFYRQGLDFDSTILGAMINNKFPFDFKLYNNKIAVIYGRSGNMETNK